MTEGQTDRRGFLRGVLAIAGAGLVGCRPNKQPAAAAPTSTAAATTTTDVVDEPVPVNPGPEGTSAGTEAGTPETKPVPGQLRPGADEPDRGKPIVELGFGLAKPEGLPPNAGVAPTTYAFVGRAGLVLQGVYGPSTEMPAGLDETQAVLAIRLKTNTPLGRGPTGIALMGDLARSNAKVVTAGIHDYEIKANDRTTTVNGTVWSATYSLADLPDSDGGYELKFRVFFGDRDHYQDLEGPTIRVEKGAISINGEVITAKTNGYGVSAGRAAPLVLS